MAEKDKDKPSDKQPTEAEDSSSILGDIIDDPVGSLIGGLKDISEQALEIASELGLDQALALFKHTPEQLELMGKAGGSLKDAREFAGLTLSELSSAIDLQNPDLLKAVEEGKVGLPFETLLRLASFYARNDPVPFVMKYARTYSPGIWSVMETLGLDKLTLEAEREIQFLNIYRSHDAARELSDDGFEKVREFTQRAFEMALHFVAEQESIDLEGEEAVIENIDDEEAEAED